MSDEYTPTTGQIARAYADGLSGTSRTLEESHDEFWNWLTAHDAEVAAKAKAEAWDHAWREIKGIPHWWNTDDQYGEFDMQPLGPDKTSEQGAFMAVREVMRNNPYRAAEYRKAVQDD